MPQSNAPITPTTINQPGSLSQVGAPIGMDPRDPRYLMWLAMQQGRTA
jgi:hypothetical protein